MTPLNIALIILNVESRHGLRNDGAGWNRFEHLWEQSSIRICADGAANRLYDRIEEPRRDSMIPDYVIGDLDSLRSEVSDYYAARGAVIKAEEDQDSHDFEKCLRWLERMQRENMRAHISSELDGTSGTPGGSSGGATGSTLGSMSSGVSSTLSGSESSSLARGYSVVACGAFGGRLDQQMANLNMAYSFACFDDLVLLGESSLAFVLQPGTHIIEPNPQVEDGSCGLIPLGGRCEGVQTSGCATKRARAPQVMPRRRDAMSPRCERMLVLVAPRVVPRVVPRVAPRIASPVVPRIAPPVAPPA